MDLGKIEISVKSGQEELHSNGEPVGFRLIDFWRWSCSDVLENTTRGVFAEFLVATALGLRMNFRAGWDYCDLVTETGLKIEVKSSSYIQSWAQKKFSKIQFGIANTFKWDDKKGFEKTACRQADVYVFCLLHHKDQNSLDIFDMSQWTFYVLTSKVLNERTGDAKIIGLNKLLSLEPQVCKYEDLDSAIKKFS